MNAIAVTFATGFAGLTLIALQTGAAADPAQKQLGVSGKARSDDVSSIRKRHGRAHPHGTYWRYEGPQACDSVVFPRSPLCPQPVTFFGFYLPWLVTR